MQVIIRRLNLPETFINFHGSASLYDHSLTHKVQDETNHKHMTGNLQAMEKGKW